ncbi:LytR family transcriptional regulator, partial [Streptomyces geysiriensis]|nr:LytR family transcriptional regulator [Streptomyces geysiriensis]
MDAQGRGRADDVDPADQWVLNPRTGEYELRLPPSAPQSPVPGPRRPAPRTGGASSPADGAASGTRRTAAPGREVPPQRRRRTAPEEPAPGRRGRRPAKKSKGKKALLWAGGSTAFVVLVAGVGGYLYLKHLEGNVTTTDVGSAGSSSFKKDEAFNILIIGTDKRTGAGNEGYGDKGSVGHADTTILLHVAEDRSNATALSIPRDLIVD